MSSDLISLLEREAAAEREKILAEARAQAEAILTEARRQAEEILTRHREQTEAEARAALVKAQSTAQIRASSLVLQAKEAEIARAFAQAEADLGRLASDGQAYPAALRAFIEEAIRAVGGQAIVAVHPADQPVAQALARENGWDVEVRADPSVKGGARVSSPDGRFIVTNTLASRLERARPLLAADVARVLWE